MSTGRLSEGSAEPAQNIYFGLRRKVIRLLLCIGFVLLPFALIYRDVFFIRSFILGLAVGLLGFHLLARGVESAARRGEKGATRDAVRYFIARYGIIAVALVIAARFGVGSIVAFAAGLLVPHAVMAVTAVAAGRRVKNTPPG